MTDNEFGFKMLEKLSVKLLAYRSMGIWTNKLQYAADKIHERQPLNPFFNYLSNGFTEQTLRLMNNQIAEIVWKRKSQWSLQREDGEKAWIDSLGWEYIFLINLGLKQ